MAKLMLIVTDVQKRAEIGPLLETAGITFRHFGAGEQKNYICTEGEAEAWVLAAPKQTLPPSKDKPKPLDYWPVFIQVKPGFFRGFTKGKIDRALQEKAEKALESIKDVTFVIR